jgi:hypothetical protein
MEPKAKKEYETKKEKEKYAVVEELIALRQTMVSEELHDEEAQSIQNMVREDAKAPPRKSKKKTKGKDKASPSTIKAHERPPSSVT